MSLTLQDWHNRFLIQAQWTKALRLYFFDLIRAHPSDRMLDMGCGTGALLQDLQALSPGEVFGSDISLEHLQLAQSENPEIKLTAADVHQLPYPDDTFEFILTHYFLMWVKDPSNALKEMSRVVKNGGYLVCFAEPDYGGRIDYPDDFKIIRENQISGLENAGADPRMGRKLRSLFHSMELIDIQSGIYEGLWNSETTLPETDSEWQMLENDLKDIITETDLAALKIQDQISRDNGSRIIHVPTFYTWGKVQK